MKLIAGYAFFYLEGREERLLKADIDTHEIAKKVVVDGGSIHELLHAAVTRAAEPLRVDRKKRQWIDDYEDDIKAMGGDSEHAYDHWIEGRIDELVSSLESEVIDEMTAIVHGDEDEDEGGDEDEDEGDDEDEDEGDDEED
jgi:hypothetical protein